MNTERTIMFGDDNINISYSEMEENERQTFWKYVELTRHLQEIRQIYQLFKCNLDHLLGMYTLMSSGQVFKNGQPAITDEDYIAVNAFVINLISTAKTLTESMESCIRKYLSEDDPKYQEYMQNYHDLYDHCFSYRLLIRLRDYAQHGHLPVSQEGNWYGFDLYQILKKPHYRHNPKMRHEIEAAVELVMDKQKQIPKISLAMTLAEFTASLLGLYSSFWHHFESLCTALYEECQTLEKEYTQNWFEYRGVTMFCYDIDDRTTHTILPYEDPEEMFNIFKEEAERAYQKYKEAWDDLKDGVKIVPL